MNKHELLALLNSVKKTIDKKFSLELKLYPIESEYNAKNCFFFESKNKSRYYFTRVNSLSGAEFVLKRAVNNTSPSNNDYIVSKPYKIYGDFDGSIVDKKYIAEKCNNSPYAVENFCNAIYGFMPGFI